MGIFAFLCSAVIVIDQVIKLFIERYLYGKSTTIIYNIFHFTYLENYGAAWGIFSDNSWILKVATPILIFCIIFYFYKLRGTKFKLALGGIITGGAIGNYIDRLFRGYVVDYIDFRIWPIFNFADVCIVVGCILFVINLIVKENKDGN